MIITFANQKGGVGKSTLAALYANYLTEIGKSVLVVDTDIQKSISERRREDESLYGKEQANYYVDFVKLDNIESSQKLMDSLSNYLSKNKENVIIMDLPGNVTENYLVPLLKGSDYIICPFSYGLLEIRSTFTFAKVVNRLKDMFRNEMGAKMIFIPNKIDRTVGTREEIKEKMRNNECLSALGELSPEILLRAELGRFNTISLTPKQRKEVEPSFNFINDIIFKEFE